MLPTKLHCCMHFIDEEIKIEKLNSLHRVTMIESDSQELNPSTRYSRDFQSCSFSLTIGTNVKTRDYSLDKQLFGRAPCSRVNY